MQHFYIEVRHSAKDGSHAGEIAEAQFEVVKGQVVVTGMDGRPIGKRKIDGDNPFADREAHLARWQTEARFLAKVNSY
jgi:hypothetical protein